MRDSKEFIEAQGEWQADMSRSAAHFLPKTHGRSRLRARSPSSHRLLRGRQGAATCRGGGMTPPQRKPTPLGLGPRPAAGRGLTLLRPPGPRGDGPGRQATLSSWQSHDCAMDAERVALGERADLARAASRCCAPRATKWHFLQRPTTLGLTCATLTHAHRIPTAAAR